MIEEAYVSFEIAKLLKEKGFNEYCFALYDSNKILIQSGIRLNNIQVGRVEGSYSAPTLQMAMKWLREVHNIFIEISVDEMFKDEGYQWALYYNSTKEIRPYSGWSGSYEGACESAIKYCLENLI